MKRFLCLILCLYVSLPLIATADGPVAFVVKVLPFTNVAPTKDGLYPVSGHSKKCVFFPVMKETYKQPTALEENAKQTADDLRSLATYNVFTKDGEQLNIKFQKFEIVAGDSNVYVTSQIPQNGCGDLLVASSVKVKQVDAPESLSKFRTLINEREKELFLSALYTAPNWLTEEQKADLSQHDLGKTYLKLKKSTLDHFTDGKIWYLVRTYSVDRVSAHDLPSAFMALILYRIDFENVKLEPELGFLNTKSGERLVNLEYAGTVDLDSDGLNEMIVRENGWEWSGYSYLERRGREWKYAKRMP